MQFFDGRLRAGQMVNSLMGLEHDTLGTPYALARSHQRCVRTYGLRTCNFTSAQLVLHSHRDLSRLESLFGDEELADLAAWREVASDKVRSVWIAKQATYHRSLVHHRASMFEGRQLITSHDPLPPGLWVVQPWPTSPLLWRHHRFLLRTWLVVPSVLPLRLYMLQDAWAHVVAKPYRPDQLMTSHKDRCVHLWSLESCSVTHAHRVLRSNHEGFTEGLVGLPRAGRDAGIDGASFWRKRVWPALEDAAVRTVASSWRELAMYERLLRSSPGVAPYRRVALLTLDWVIDEGGRPVLMDVDVDGGMAADELPLSHKYALEALHLVGVHGYERQGYGARAHSAIDTFCARRRSSVDQACTVAARAALMDAVDEAHHSGAYARLFPPAAKGCGRYCHFLEPLPPEAAPGGRSSARRRLQADGLAAVAAEDGSSAGQSPRQGGPRTGSTLDRLTWDFLRTHPGLFPPRARLPAPKARTAAPASDLT